MSAVSLRTAGVMSGRMWLSHNSLPTIDLYRVDSAGLRSSKCSGGSRFSTSAGFGSDFTLLPKP